MPLCCVNQHPNPAHKIWCVACESLIEGARVGDCTIIKYLGHGSSGAIYLAYQQSLNKRKVVIKVLRSVQSLTNVADFRREAELLASLAHPYILPIYAFDIVEERREEPLTYVPYLVLPYAEQGSLEDAFEREGGKGWPLERVLPVMSEAAEALDYAHRCRVLHRDVKPANILRNGSHILLSDFGVATLIDVESSHLSAPWAGSPAYMAPEVWNYQPGRYSDLYALAITCYRLLAGSYPWHVDDDDLVYNWMHHHCHVAPCPLYVYRSDLPSAVGEVLLRALAKDPHQRFSSGTAFATALRQAESTLPCVHSVQAVTGGAALSIRRNLLVEGRPVEAASGAARTLEVVDPEPETVPMRVVSTFVPIEQEAQKLDLIVNSANQGDGRTIEETVERETTHLLVSRYRIWLAGAFVLNLLVCSILLIQAMLVGGAQALSNLALPLWPSLLIGPLLGLLFHRLRVETLSWGIVYGILFGGANALISILICWLWTALLSMAAQGSMWLPLQAGWSALVREAVIVLHKLPLPGLAGLWLSVIGGIVLGILVGRQGEHLP